MLERGRDDKMQAGCKKKFEWGGYQRGVKKTKCGGRRGAVAKKLEGGMPERGKGEKMWGGGGLGPVGGGVCVPEWGKEDKMQGGGGLWKKFGEGGVKSGRGKEDKMQGGGSCEKKLSGDAGERVKTTKMLGVAK